MIEYSGTALNNELYPKVVAGDADAKLRMARNNVGLVYELVKAAIEKYPKMTAADDNQTSEEKQTELWAVALEKLSDTVDSFSLPKKKKRIDNPTGHIVTCVNNAIFGKWRKKREPTVSWDALQEGHTFLIRQPERKWKLSKPDDEGRIICAVCNTLTSNYYKCWYAKRWLCRDCYESQTSRRFKFINFNESPISKPEPVKEWPTLDEVLKHCVDEQQRRVARAFASIVVDDVKPTDAAAAELLKDISRPTVQRLRTALQTALRDYLQPT